MSRYLITGGLGVIGSLLARRALAAGHQVDIIDACEEPRNYWTANQLRALCRDPERLGIYLGHLEEAFGVRDDNKGAAELPELLARADKVIHAAAHTGIPHSIVEPRDDWSSNVDATLVLMEALRKDSRPTVVLSSIKPYRVQPLPPDGLTEDAVLSPDEPYAASKAAQSMLCQAWARSYGLPVVTFRCSNLYGPAPCHGPRHGWLTWFCISAALGRDIEVQGDGNQTRDMLYIDDIANAIDRALTSAEAFSGEIFNLGGGLNQQISVIWAARQLERIASVKVKFAPPRQMDDQAVFVDTRSLRAATGWEPVIRPQEGLLATYAWAQANRDELAMLYKDV